MASRSLREGAGPVVAGLLVLVVVLGGLVAPRPLGPSGVADREFTPASSSHLRATVNPVSVSLTVNPGRTTEGQTVSVQATANGGTPPYSFAYSGLPNGCQGQNGASFTCNPSSSGTYSIQVTATDSRGNQSSPSNSVSLTVTSSNNGNSNGNGNGNGNNSSNGLSSLFSGFSGVLSLLFIVGIVGFATWILLIVGVWIIAVTLVRRLPKRGEWGTPIASSKCAACGAAIAAGSKFCASCGASTAPKAP